MKAQYKAAYGPSYGLHLGVNFGAGFVWLQVFAISLKPVNFVTYTRCTLAGYAKYISTCT